MLLLLLLIIYYFLLIYKRDYFRKVFLLKMGWDFYIFFLFKEKKEKVNVN